MLQLNTTVEVDAEGEAELRFKTDLAPGKHRLTVLLEEMTLDHPQERPPLPTISVGAVLSDQSLRREDLYRDFGR